MHPEGFIVVGTGSNKNTLESAHKPSTDTHDMKSTRRREQGFKVSVVTD